MKIPVVLLLALYSLNLSAKDHNSPSHDQHKISVVADSLNLDSLIKKHTLNLVNGKFQGNGWEILQKEAQKAQFVLIGEQHGVAEIPFFTGRIAEMFKPAALIGEIDPYTATQLKKTSLDTSKYTEYFKRNPYDFAFYSFETEMALARQMQLSHIDIWGLNEVNFLSMSSFFNHLSAAAKIPANKKIAAERATAYNRNDRPLYADIGNRYKDFSANQLKVSTVDSLLYDFRNESPLCKKMLNDLKTSIPIFANASYQARVNLMKKNLMNYVAPFIKGDSINIPKLLFKFGANHVPRTNDLTGSFEVGSLADNLADAAGKKTLHIMVVGKKGTMNTMSPVDNDKAIKPYELSKGGLAFFTPFSERLTGSEWAVFDLRPIRKAIKEGKFHPKESELQDFVMGYDLLVVSAQMTGNKFL